MVHGGFGHRPARLTHLVRGAAWHGFTCGHRIGFPRFLGVNPPAADLADRFVDLRPRADGLVITDCNFRKVPQARNEEDEMSSEAMLSLQASAGAKNGYIPDLNKLTPNYVLGLGLRIPIFDGMKNKYSVSQAQSAITSLMYESDFTRRNISNELYEAEAYMSAAEKKVSQFILQLSQAEKANSLAETSFKSGVITNLDLLDANTSVSESRLMLLKSRIDYAASIYKLKAALGERIY